jgi:hypothetical protein
MCAASQIPTPFLKPAERLGVEPARCLALEDSHNGVRAASGAGMMTIMVPDLLASTSKWHGYGRVINRRGESERDDGTDATHRHQRNRAADAAGW